MRSRHSLLSLAVLVLGCASPMPPEGALPVPARALVEACAEREAVVPYLTLVQQRVARRWASYSTRQRDLAKINFRIAANGSVSEIHTLSSTSKRLALRGHEVIQSASPFGPLGRELRCLQEIPLIATFHHPSFKARQLTITFPAPEAWSP